MLLVAVVQKQQRSLLRPREQQGTWTGTHAPVCSMTADPDPEHEQSGVCVQSGMFHCSSNHHFQNSLISHWNAARCRLRQRDGNDSLEALFSHAMLNIKRPPAKD